MPTPSSQPPPPVKGNYGQRNGWFKVWREDRATIIEHCEGAALAALAVWDALCDLANEHKARTFTATIGVIRTRAGTSRATTFRALGMLSELGMISHESARDERNKKHLLPSKFTLLTQSHSETTPSLREQGNCCDNGLKKSTPKRSRLDSAVGKTAALTGQDRSAAQPTAGKEKEFEGTW